MTVAGSPGRNQRCPCGSGEKYKLCCGRLVTAPRRDRAAALADGAVAQFNLGNALARGSRLDEALQAYQRALQIEPGFAQAQLHRGRVLLELGRADEAVASLRQAIALDAGLVEAHVHLANALRRIGRLDEAVEGYRRALCILPDSVPILVQLATALRLQRRTAEAEATCRRVLDLDAGSAAIRNVLAELRADLGEFAEAQALFERALDLDPESVKALTGLARVRRMTAADHGWRDAVLGLAARHPDTDLELELRYALGKHFDDVHEYTQAFAHFQRANELAKRRGPAHDRTRLTQSVDALIRAHDRAWLARPGLARLGLARPESLRSSGDLVFIVGTLRSGTSLAEQILASHPAVFGAGEQSFWATAVAASMSAALAGDEQALKPDEDRLAALSADYRTRLSGIADREQAGRCADAPPAPPARWVDKMPTNFWALGWIHAACPAARIIHMTRDPQDTCLSIYFQHLEAANTYANDLDDLAHYYREYRRLMHHWRALLPAHRMVEVPYEGLVADLEGWTRKMLEFIDLPWNPRCLDFHATRRSVVTASKWQVRQPLDASAVGRARHYARYLGPLRSLR